MRSLPGALTLGPTWKPAALPAVLSEPLAFHGRRLLRTRGLVMKWETPQAFDQRFGFEITMYISTR